MQSSSIKGGNMSTLGLKEMAQSRDLKLGHFIVEFATPFVMPKM